MKTIITNIIITAALSLPGARSLRSQEAPATPPRVSEFDSQRRGDHVLLKKELDTVAVIADDALGRPEQEAVSLLAAGGAEQELAMVLAEVQQQVKAELALKLEVGEAAAADATEAGAKATPAQRQIAAAHRAVVMAQAGAPAAPRAVPGSIPAPAPAFQQRLQNVVSRSHGGPGKSLVIRTSDAEAKSQAKLEEDLAIMSRILDKKLAQLNDDKPRRAMGIDVFFGPGSSPIRSLYLEGYGALFLMGVHFPLLPPAEKAEAKEKSETESTWDDAKRELSGHGDAWGQVGKAFKFATAGGPPEEYDEQKVNELTDGLLEALKNATNIRNLKPDETITVCVFGGLSAMPAKVRVTARPKPPVSDDEADELQVFLADRENGPPARGTIMTIRVKKSDVDAFAQGKLSADEFRTKAAIIAYAGDTGGWGGGGGSAFGLTPN